MPKTIEVLDPVGISKAIQLSRAPRVDHLNGKVIGLLDNSKPNADILLGRVQELLAERFKVDHFVKKRKLWNGSPAPREMIQELAEKCDVIVNALGD